MPEYRNEKSKIIIKKRERKSSLIIFNIIDLILVGLIVVLFYVTMPITSTKVLFIPKGSTSYIISYLNKNGFDMGIVDEVVIKASGYVQSGWIDIGENRLTRMDFIYKLITAKAALKNITLIPGETSYIFLKRLASEFNLSEEKLTQLYNQYAYKSDGNILADTYSLPIGMKEDYMIFYLFSQTNKRYEEFSKKIFGYYDKRKWFNYLSLASVIQKEAATINEMPIVASVIHNRLKKGMKLQMDGTLNYGEYSNTVVTADRIRDDNTTYNTYKNPSLPTSPVCAVSLDAIKAGIFPVKSDYIYFVRDNKTGLHKFSSTYDAHQANISANVGVAKTYTKVKDDETLIDEEAETIMKTDVTKQKPVSVKDLFNNIN
jgi:UPF0755 protein